MTYLYTTSVLVWIWVFLGRKVIILVPNPKFFIVMNAFKMTEAMLIIKTEITLESSEPDLGVN